MFSSRNPPVAALAWDRMGQQCLRILLDQRRRARTAARQAMAAYTLCREAVVLGGGEHGAERRGGTRPRAATCATTVDSCRHHSHRLRASGEGGENCYCKQLVNVINWELIRIVGAYLIFFRESGHTSCAEHFVRGRVSSAVEFAKRML